MVEILAVDVASCLAAIGAAILCLRNPRSRVPNLYLYPWIAYFAMAPLLIPGGGRSIGLQAAVVSSGAVAMLVSFTLLRWPGAVAKLFLAMWIALGFPYGVALWITWAAFMFLLTRVLADRPPSRPGTQGEGVPVVPAFAVAVLLFTGLKVGIEVGSAG